MPQRLRRLFRSRQKSRRAFGRTDFSVRYYHLFKLHDKPKSVGVVCVTIFPSPIQTYVFGSLPLPHMPSATQPPSTECTVRLFLRRRLEESDDRRMDNRILRWSPRGRLNWSLPCRTGRTSHRLFCRTACRIGSSPPPKKCMRDNFQEGFGKACSVPRMY